MDGFPRITLTLKVLLYTNRLLLHVLGVRDATFCEKKEKVSFFSSADNGGSVARGKVSFLSIILCPVYMKSNV